MAAFPIGLPEPFFEPYTLEPQPNTIRTDMEAGAVRMRRRFTGRIKQFTLGWILTSAQVSTFTTFYEADIKDGVEWFDMNLDLGNGVNTLSECRFMEPYVLRSLGFGTWRIDARVERR